MKNALSLRHGRQLIDSSEADYNSYLSLSLVCPVCLQPVYYVASTKVPKTERHYKSGKVSVIKEHTKESYFKHFKDQSEEEAAACERRSRSLVKERSLKQINSQIRGQRLESFKARIDRLFYFNSYLSDINYILPIARLDFASALVENIPKIKTNKQVEVYYTKIQRIIHGKLQGEKAYILSGMEEFLNGTVKGIRFCPDNLKYIANPIELKLHLATCCEIVDFLFAPGNFSYSQKLIQYSFFRAVLLANLACQLEVEIKPERHSFLKDALSKSSYSSILDDSSPDELIKKITNTETFVEFFTTQNIKNSSYLDYLIIKEVFIAAIALTPWADAFAYFDGILEPEKQITSVQHSKVFAYVKEKTVAFLSKSNFSDLGDIKSQLFAINSNWWKNKEPRNISFESTERGVNVIASLEFSQIKTEAGISYRGKISFSTNNLIIGEFWMWKTLINKGKQDLFYKRTERFLTHIHPELAKELKQCNSVLEVKSGNNELVTVATAIACKLFYGEV